MNMPELFNQFLDIFQKSIELLNTFQALSEDHQGLSPYSPSHHAVQLLVRDYSTRTRTPAEHPWIFHYCWPYLRMERNDMSILVGR